MTNKIDIKIKYAPDAKKVFKEFESSSGFDAFAYIKDKNGNPARMLIPRGRCIIPLGFSVALPLHYRMHPVGRSGMLAKGMKGYGTKDGIAQDRFQAATVCLGTVDSNYRGMVGAIMWNEGVPFYLQDGDPVCQLLVTEDPDISLSEVDELPIAYERGEQGFNS